MWESQGPGSNVKQSYTIQCPSRARSKCLSGVDAGVLAPQHLHLALEPLQLLRLRVHLLHQLVPLGHLLAAFVRRVRQQPHALAQQPALQLPLLPRQTAHHVQALCVVARVRQQLGGLGGQLRVPLGQLGGLRRFLRSGEATPWCVYGPA